MRFSRRPAMLVLTLFGCGQDADGEARVEPFPAMALEELASWPVADPTWLVGGAILGARSVIASTTDGELWTFRVGEDAPTRIHNVRASLLGRPVGVPQDADGVLAVSRVDGSLLHIRETGVVDSPGIVCPELLSATDMDWMEEGIVALLDEGGTRRPVLVRFSLGESLCTRRDSVGLGLPCPRGEPSMAPGNVFPLLLACPEPTQPLFAVRSPDADLHLTRIYESLPAQVAVSYRTGGPLWVGLPLLRLDNGYLRVISDLRSHTRRFELWTDAGEHVRTSTVNEPIGFVDSSPDHRLLVGMRGKTDFRIVLFRWSWVPASSP